MAKSSLYSSKPRYEILDGLRGVAALMVLLYHHFETFGPGIKTFHGYLAVDFFFILSGFVIGYSYDDRWKSRSNPGGMTLGQFLKRRITRLHPMYVFGTVFGLLMLMFGWSDALPNIADAHWQRILACLGLALIMIPVPHSLDVRGWGDFNPYNGNSWTLTFEYVANLLYAFIIRHFSKILLAVFVGMAAILTIGVGLDWDFFGVMADRPAEYLHTFIGGWSLEPNQLLLGFTRLLFPFFAGLLMARCISAPKADSSEGFLSRHGFLLASILLVAVLAVPYLGDGVNGIVEALTILLLFPLIVWIGAKGKVSGRAGKFCKWLGDISYPLYITHSPIIFTLCEGWKSNHTGASPDQVLLVCISSILLSISLAWAALKLYDEPVRDWLKEHWRCC